MAEKPKATPQSAATNAARAGVSVDETGAARIANAISPALGNFDCPSLALPMEEEPSGWTQRALSEARS